jgi:hypothetical protein
MLQFEMTHVSKQEDGGTDPFLKDHQIWEGDSSPVDLEAPAEEGTKMGIVVWVVCVVCWSELARRIPVL